MAKICVFDAYGTLFDVNAAARQAAEKPGWEALAEIWPTLAEDWRRKQLEYSWLRAVTGDYVSFWQVTQDGLDWAMERAGLDDLELREGLLALYWELPPFKDAVFALAGLRARGIPAAILSNGNKDMLEGAVDKSGLGSYLDAVLSVEEVQTFKPARVVYDMVTAHYGVAPGDVLFVSSNGWDAAGAAEYGFETVWVNRSGLPLDRLMAVPTHVVNDLSKIPEMC
jgi:2-haloacid dehalogenase